MSEEQNKPASVPPKENKPPPEPPPPSDINYNDNIKSDYPLPRPQASTEQEQK